MRTILRIDAAASSHIGRIRKKNEDNLLFSNKTLSCDHKNLHWPFRKSLSLREDKLFCIFDGVGGEDFGEIASYTAAISFKQESEMHKNVIENKKDFLNRACVNANRAILKVSKEHEPNNMGCTVATLFFTEDTVYVCNVGDSKAFRLRDDELMQLSKDHVESISPQSGEHRGKAAITQYLGIPEDELRIEPYIAKGDIRRGDQYLLCSDGLTDMLTNVEICSILKHEDKTISCVDKLIKEALLHGGRDNITVILCRVI